MSFALFHIFPRFIRIAALPMLCRPFRIRHHAVIGRFVGLLLALVGLGFPPCSQLGFLLFWTQRQKCRPLAFPIAPVIFRTSCAKFFILMVTFQEVDPFPCPAFFRMMPFPFPLPVCVGFAPLAPFGFSFLHMLPVICPSIFPEPFPVALPVCRLILQGFFMPSAKLLVQRLQRR